MWYLVSINSLFTKEFHLKSIKKILLVLKIFSCKWGVNNLAIFYALKSLCLKQLLGEIFSFYKLSVNNETKMLITVSKNERIRIYPDFFKNKTVKIGNVATSIRIYWRRAGLLSTVAGDSNWVDGCMTLMYKQ